MFGHGHNVGLCVSVIDIGLYYENETRGIVPHAKQTLLFVSLRECRSFIYINMWNCSIHTPQLTMPSFSRGFIVFAFVTVESYFILHAKIRRILINQSIKPSFVKWVGAYPQNAPCRRCSHALRSAPVRRGRLLSTVLHRWSQRHSILSAGLR